MKKVKWNGEGKSKLFGIPLKDKPGMNKLSVLYKELAREVDDETYDRLVKKHGDKIKKVKEE